MSNQTEEEEEEEDLTINCTIKKIQQDGTVLLKFSTAMDNSRLEQIGPKVLNVTLKLS